MSRSRITFVCSVCRRAVQWPMYLERGPDGGSWCVACTTDYSRRDLAEFGRRWLSAKKARDGQLARRVMTST